MNKSLIRIVSLLLVPCLIADPVTATALPNVFETRTIASPLQPLHQFNEQALAERLSGFFATPDVLNHVQAIVLGKAVGLIDVHQAASTGSSHHLKTVATVTVTVTIGKMLLSFITYFTIPAASSRLRNIFWLHRPRYTPKKAVFRDYYDLSYKAVDKFITQVNGKPDSAFLLPTGNTPKMFYDLLIKAAKNKQVDLTHIKIFMLDEYWGGEDYHHYIQRIMDQLPKDNRPAEVHLLNGLAPDWKAETAAYEQKIKDAGGIDFCILGVGTRGHIGFNEKYSSFASRTRKIRLDPQTIQDNRPLMEKQDSPYTEALTVGIGTILDSKEIILLANGDAKAEAIDQLFLGRPNERWPISALQLHQKVTMLVDYKAWYRVYVNRFDPTLRPIKWMGSGGFNTGVLVEMPDGKQAALIIAGNENWGAESLPVAQNNLAQLAETQAALQSVPQTGRLYKVFEPREVKLGNERVPVVSAILREYFAEPNLIQALQNHLIPFDEARRQILEIADAYEQQGYSLLDGVPDNFYYRDGKLWHADLGLTHRIDQLKKDGLGQYEIIDGKKRFGNLTELFKTLQNFLPAETGTPSLFGFSTGPTEELPDKIELIQQRPEYFHLFKDSNHQTFLDQLTALLQHIPEYETIRSNPRIRMPPYFQDISNYDPKRLALANLSYVLRYPVVNIASFQDRITDESMAYAFALVAHDYGHVVDENGGIDWIAPWRGKAMRMREALLTRKLSRSAQERLSGTLLDLRAEIYRLHYFPMGPTDPFAAQRIRQAMSLPERTTNDDYLVQLARAVVFCQRVGATDQIQAIRAHIQNPRALAKVNELVDFMQEYVAALRYDPDWARWIPDDVPSNDNETTAKSNGGAATTVGDDLTPEKKTEVYAAILRGWSNRKPATIDLTPFKETRPELFEQLKGARIYLVNSLTPFNDDVVAYGGFFGDAHEPAICFSPRQFKRFLNRTLDAQAQLLTHELGEIENVRAGSPLTEAQLRNKYPIDLVQKEWAHQADVRPEWRDEIIARELRELNRDLYTNLVLGESIPIDEAVERLESLREQLIGSREPLDSKITPEEKQVLDQSILAIQKNLSGESKKQSAEEQESKEHLASKLTLSEKLLKAKNTAAALAVMIGAYNYLRTKSERQRRNPQTIRGPLLPSFTWFGDSGNQISGKETKMLIDADGSVWIFRQEQFRGAVVAGKKHQLPSPTWVFYPDVPTTLRALGHALDCEAQEIRDLVFVLALLDQAKVELNNQPPNFQRADELVSSVAGWIDKSIAPGKKHVESDLNNILRALRKSEPSASASLSLIATTQQTLRKWRLQEVKGIIDAVKEQRRTLRKLQSEHQNSTEQFRKFVNETPRDSDELRSWLFKLTGHLNQFVFHGHPRKVNFSLEYLRALYLDAQTTPGGKPKQTLVIARQVASAFKSVCVSMGNTSSWLTGTTGMSRYAATLSFIPKLLSSNEIQSIENQLRAQATRWRRAGHVISPNWLVKAADILSTPNMFMPGTLAPRLLAALSLLKDVSTNSKQWAESTRPETPPATPSSTVPRSLARTIYEQTSAALNQLSAVDMPTLYAELQKIYPEGHWPQNLLHDLEIKAGTTMLSEETQSALDYIRAEILRILDGSDDSAAPSGQVPPSTPGGDSGLTGRATSSPKDGGEENPGPPREKGFMSRELAKAV